MNQAVEVSVPARTMQRQFEPLEVSLLKVVEEAPGIKSFFSNYDKNRFHKSSQAARLYFENEPSMYRPFSIASSPTEDFLLFTARIRAESDYKQRLNMLGPGDRLTVLGPVGNFILPEDSSKQAVFLGGGIGITPFRSMAKFATDEQLPNQIVLFYSNRAPKDSLPA